jgi:hypothetical protein
MRVLSVYFFTDVGVGHGHRMVVDISPEGAHHRVLLYPPRLKIIEVDPRLLEKAETVETTPGVVQGLRRTIKMMDAKGGRYQKERVLGVLAALDEQLRMKAGARQRSRAPLVSPATCPDN